METDALAWEDIITKRSIKPSKLVPLRPGSRSDPAGKAVNNVILLSLPDKEYNLLRPHLEPAELPQYEILHESGAKIDFSYFLNDGMASIVALSHDGRSVEVGIVGKEGMVGMPLTVGLQRGTFRAIMQMTGSWITHTVEGFSRRFSMRADPSIRTQPLRSHARPASCTTGSLQSVCMRSSSAWPAGCSCVRIASIPNCFL